MVGAPALCFLVATDGSPHARAALRFVADLARRGVALHAHVVHVQRPLVADERGLQAPAEVARTPAQVLAEAAALLAEAGVRSERDLRFDDPAESIVATARERGCDAIVLGARGNGPLVAALLGSVSRGVLRRADRPVFVLGAPQAALPQGPLRLLAATDGSAPATRAIAAAVRLAAALPEASAVALAVQPPLTMIETLALPRERLVAHWSAEAVRAALEAAHGRFAAAGLACTTRVAEDDAPARAILRVAAEEGCGLIAMGTRGRNPLPELLLGSVAQHVLRDARVPVLLAR